MSRPALLLLLLLPLAALAEEPPLGVGEASSGPAGAAIANAVHDATGLRLRETANRE